MMIASESGIRNAPDMPWKTRATTSIVKLSAAPQKIEATVNPATAHMYTRFRPKRLLSQPEVGIMIAEATM